MTTSLEPAAALAAKMNKTATGASDAYLAARRAILVEEIELRRHTERVAAMRRALPPGPEIREDYVLKEPDAAGGEREIALSSLFSHGSDSLVVYHYMFPRHRMDTRPTATAGALGEIPRDEQPCPSCTTLIDQLDAAVPHFEAAGGNFVVVAKAPPAHLAAVKADRCWRHVRLLSAHGTTFKRDVHAEDEDGQQMPLMTVFRRDADGTIRLFWSSDLMWTDADPGQDHRAAGTIEPFWNLFDMTARGRPDFKEQLKYGGCCDA